MPTIIRSHPPKDRFTIISNAAVRDKRLSMESRGMLAWLLSHDKGWQTSVRGVCKEFGVGKDKASRVLSELEDAGYLTRFDQERSGGKFGGGVWDVTDAPCTQNPPTVDAPPCTQKPMAGEPVSGKTDDGSQVHKEEQNNKKTNSEELSSNPQVEDLDDAAVSPHGDDPVREVFDYWRNATGHTSARFSDERRRVIRARLRDKFTVDDLKAAIDGCCASPFHMGANDGNKRYDGLDLIFRNVSKVEEFIKLGADCPASFAGVIPPGSSDLGTRQKRSQIQAEWLADEITETERDRRLAAIGASDAV